MKNKNHFRFSGFSLFCPVMMCSCPRCFVSKNTEEGFMASVLLVSRSLSDTIYDCAPAGAARTCALVARVCSPPEVFRRFVAGASRCKDWIPMQVSQVVYFILVSFSATVTTRTFLFHRRHRLTESTYSWVFSEAYIYFIYAENKSVWSYFQVICLEIVFSAVDVLKHAYIIRDLLMIQAHCARRIWQIIIEFHSGA